MENLIVDTKLFIRLTQFIKLRVLTRLVCEENIVSCANENNRDTSIFCHKERNIQDILKYLKSKVVPQIVKV